jgi:putative MATE family efflux protein
VIIGIVAAPLLAFFADAFVSLLGASDDVVDFAVSYLRISAIGVPFVVAGLAAQGVQRGAQDFRTALVVLVAANLVNAVVEMVLVFGYDLGVAGAAWSTAVSQVGAGIALCWRSRRFLVDATERRPRWAQMQPLVAAGRHLMLRVMSMLAVFTGSTSIAARIDDATLAAHSIAITVFLFLALALDALAVPAQTLVADELGRGGPGALVVARRTIRLSIRFGVVLAVVLGLSAPLVARVFSSESDVISRATVALVLLALLVVPGSIAFATDGALIGAGDYRFLGRAAFAYLLAVAPIAAVVLAVDDLGVIGIWVGLLVWMILRAAVNLWRVLQLLDV